MKNLKNKLIAAATMLVVSATMLGGTSYAWYTLSTNPEVTDITATVVANENLEIAYRNSDTAPDDKGAAGDTNTATKYGNLVTPDMNDSYDTSGAELRPVKASGSTLVTVNYGEDGRVFEENVGLTEEGTGTVLLSKDGTPYALRLDFWVKTNLAGTTTLALTDVANRGQGVSGAGSTVTGFSKFDVNGLLKVGFSLDGGTIVEGSVGSDGKITCENIGSLTQNTDHKLSVYFYIDGTVATNANALLQAEDLTFNLQFTNGATNAMRE